MIPSKVLFAADFDKNLDNESIKVELTDVADMRIKSPLKTLEKTEKDQKIAATKFYSIEIAKQATGNEEPTIQQTSANAL